MWYNTFITSALKYSQLTQMSYNIGHVTPSYVMNHAHISHHN